MAVANADDKSLGKTYFVSKIVLFHKSTCKSCAFTKTAWCKKLVYLMTALNFWLYYYRKKADEFLPKIGGCLPGQILWKVWSKRSPSFSVSIATKDSMSLSSTSRSENTLRIITRHCVHLWLSKRHTHTQPFIGPLSRTNQVRWY